MLGNCSNEMKLVVRVPHGMQFRNQNNFRSSLRRKKFVLSLLSYEISEFNFFIHSFFHNARNLIKSNVIHSQSSSGYLVSKSKKIPIQLSQKKVRSLVVFVRNKGICFFHIQLFQNVRKLSKSNETHSQSSSQHVVSKSKRISDLACVEKSSFSQCFRTK